MSAPTRILGAAALTLVVLVAVAVHAAIGAPRVCLVPAVFAVEGAARGGEIVEWTGEEAARAFLVLADAGFSFAGDEVLTVAFPDGSAMIGIIRHGALCLIVPAVPERWAFLRRAVEGSRVAL
jgi:hypothetical protein